VFNSSENSKALTTAELPAQSIAIITISQIGSYLNLVGSPLPYF